MLDRRVSCKLIGVPRQPFHRYVEAARTWLGGDEAAHTPLGGDEPEQFESFITWLEPEAVEIEGSDWLRQADELRFYSRRGIAKIGSYSQLDAIAIISGFASVTAALENHVRRYIARSLNPETAKIYDFEIDLQSVHAKCNLLPNAPRIRFVEGRRHDDNAVISITASPNTYLEPLIPYRNPLYNPYLQVPIGYYNPYSSKPSTFPGVPKSSLELDLLSLGVNMEGTDITIYKNSTVHVDTDGEVTDLSVTLAHVPERLTWVWQCVSGEVKLVTGISEYEEDPAAQFLHVSVNAPTSAETNRDSASARYLDYLEP